MGVGYDFDLVCIGSGPAGQRGAVQAAKFGKRVALVHDYAAVGGVCLHTGTIPSKAFREAILSLTTGPNPFQSSWWRPPDSTPSMQELLERVNGLVQQQVLVQENQLRRNGVTLLQGTARFVDSHTLAVQPELGEIRTITTENVLIAVGSRSSASKKNAD